MPAIQSVVLTDRATPTPINHTLTPVNEATPGVFAVAKNNGTLLGEIKLSISDRRVGGKKKTRLVFSYPVVQTETVSGISRPVVLRTGYADLTFTFDLGSSEQERKDVVGMLASALESGKLLINDTVVKGESVY